MDRRATSAATGRAWCERRSWAARAPSTGTAPRGSAGADRPRRARRAASGSSLRGLRRDGDPVLEGPHLRRRRHLGQWGVGHDGRPFLHRRRRLCAGDWHVRVRPGRPACGSPHPPGASRWWPRAPAVPASGSPAPTSLRAWRTGIATGALTCRQWSSVGGACGGASKACGAGLLCTDAGVRASTGAVSAF